MTEKCSFSLPDLDVNVGSRDDLDLAFVSWPDNFASLFDMGLKAFERLFNHRPHLKMLFSKTNDEQWRKDDRIKKIVLTLEQTLVQAVATFADPKPDPEKGGKEFVQMMQEIGGLHRAILPHLLPDNFELLFKLLPEVIVDVVSARRKDGPLTSHDRSRLLAVWCSICDLMSSHFSQGWERCVIPKSDKFNKAYRFDKREESEHDLLQRNTPPLVTSRDCPYTTPKIGMRRESAACSIAASHRTNRSRTQDEVMPWQLSRGHSAPLGIHEVDLQVDSARQPPL